MTEQDKQLLLKDLCGRLPYGVIVQSRIVDFNTEESAHDSFPNHVKHPSYVGDGRLFLVDNLSKSVRVRPILKGLTYREKVFFEEICNNGYISIDECKPYLFPLSSMTIEQRNEFYEMTQPYILASFDEGKLIAEENEYRPITPIMMYPNMVEIDWMYKRHFDVFGLIEKGLAIDATNLNIYKR